MKKKVEENNGRKRDVGKRKVRKEGEKEERREGGAGTGEGEVMWEE